jgi:putative ABC transport system permease protein
MLGIIIGIAAIISIVSTIKGTNEEIKNNLIGSGNNTVEIKLYQNGWEYSFYSASDIPFGIPEVSDETCEEILALDSVENVTRYNERQNSEGVYYQNTGLSDVGIRGIDTSYFETNGYILRTGRNFIASDYENYRKVLILDQTACDSLFKNEDPIGKTIEINQVPFTVIGVVDTSSSFEPTISSVEDYYNYVYSSESSGYLYMPKATWPIVYAYDEPENVIVRAVSTDDMEEAGQKAQDILNATISSSQTSIKYKADNLLEQAEQLQELSNATNKQLVWIASIALLVGGIGVMNIMLVSVTERTSEIGLKKAIGARKGTILGQFLTEAAVLTSLGGIFGVAAGIGMAQIINRISGSPVSISVPASVIAVLFSMMIGIVFGLFPAVKAANLDPIEALRRE